MPFDHFDFIAGLYDRAGKFTLQEPLLGLLSLSPKSLLLDAGGGTGRIADALRVLVQDVYIVDSSRGMLRRAVEKGINSICTQVESLPLSSGSVDRIIMMDALHHVADQHQAIYELWRLLTPGGRIVIIEPDIQKWSVKLIALAEKILLMRSHFLNHSQITSLIPSPDARIEVVFDTFNVFCVAEKLR